MKSSKLKRFIISLFIFFCFILNTSAESKYIVTTNAANIRKGPSTKYAKIDLADVNTSYPLKTEKIYADEAKNGDCNAGWYAIEYKETTAYICAAYAVIKDTNEPSKDAYDRPWTSPKSAIIGGAKFISTSYISKGQFTSYLKKFNVNPNGAYSVYNHQYMANLAAPYSEAYTSYKSYSANNLLNLPLEFTIPVFENMPENTVLPGSTANTTCQSAVKDTKFEALLDAEKFPESYKCKLRALHAEFPEWTFKALITGLDFNTAVKREQRVSSIQGTTYYQKTTATECRNGFGGTAKNGYCQTESGWYIANTNTVAFYLDPRNFLVKERILMFEHLAYSDKYSEKVVASILKGTFMEDLSVLDNMTYAQIFYEAGKTANISAVYLASLAIQESGTKVSNTTNGSSFTYDGVTYKGLYNFFNIGASSGASNPALAGLVWASGGSEDPIVGPDGNNNVTIPSNPGTSENSPEPTTPTTPSDKPSEPKPADKPTSTLTEEKILSSLSAAKKNNCLTSLALGTKVSTLKSKLKDLTVTIENAKDTDTIKTGQEIIITDGIKTFTYTIVVSGDVDGDGKIGAADYVKIKNYIMEKKNSELNLAQSLAADVDGNGKIGAPDYVRIKNSIMKG